MLCGMHLLWRLKAWCLCKLDLDLEDLFVRVAHESTKLIPGDESRHHLGRLAAHVIMHRVQGSRKHALPYKRRVGLRIVVGVNRVVELVARELRAAIHDSLDA